MVCAVCCYTSIIRQILAAEASDTAPCHTPRLVQEADERAKDLAKADKLTKPQIHAMLDLFDISRGSGDAGKKVRSGWESS